MTSVAHSQRLADELLINEQITQIITCYCSMLITVRLLVDVNALILLLKMLSPGMNSMT